MTPAVLSRARRAAAEWRFKRRLAAPKLFRAFADAYPQAFFVEIGSNDGEQHDHLRPFIVSSRWSGIMVEPVPYVFERLRANYGDLDRVTLENAAIADRDGRMPFYHLAQAGDEDLERLPSWYDGIGSFSREAVLGHARHIPDIDERLVETSVPCLAFDSLLERHGVERVDLLLIDTEGYDWEILRGLDLRRHRPRMVVFEHYHLPAETRARARTHLGDLGWETMEEGFDTFCLRADPDDALARQWRRVTPGVPGLYAEDEER
jgi:FkbM family methyltransferase